MVAWPGNDSRHDVFAVSRVNNHLMHTFKLLSGATKIRGQPHAVSTAPNSLDVFAWGEATGELLYKTYDAVAQKWSPDDKRFTTLIPGGLVGPPNPMADGGDVHVFAYNSQNQIVWQTIGPDKKAKGDVKVLADVPYNVA